MCSKVYRFRVIESLSDHQSGLPRQILHPAINLDSDVGTSCRYGSSGIDKQAGGNLAIFIAGLALKTAHKLQNPSGSRLENCLDAALCEHATDGSQVHPAGRSIPNAQHYKWVGRTSQASRNMTDSGMNVAASRPVNVLKRLIVIREILTEGPARVPWREERR